MRPVAMRRRPGSVPSRFSRQRPADASVRPAIIRSNVLLPQPDGPSRLRNSPRDTARSTPSSASSPEANRFATRCTRTIGSGPVSSSASRAGSELPDNPDKTQRQQHKPDQLGRGQTFAKKPPRDEIAEKQFDQ